MSTVGISLEEGRGLLYEIFALFDSLFDVDDVGRGGLGNGKGLGGVNHKDGKLELDVRVLSLFGVGAVELKGSFVGQEGCLLSGSQVRMVEDRPRWRGVGTNGLGGDGAWRAESRLVRVLIALVKVIRLGRGCAVIVDVLRLDLWRVVIREMLLVLLGREKLRGGARRMGSTGFNRGGVVVSIRIVLGL